MTFAEYNTDDYFKNSASSADGLVKTAFKEGKTREEVENSLSPLWKEDKKGNVKKALDTYYKTQTAPTVETTTEETTEEVPSLTPYAEEEVTLKKRDKEHLDNTNNKGTYQEQKELNKVVDNKENDYDYTFDTMKRSGQMFRNIDDHAMDNLPTFMFRRFQNGEFGDPKGKDAKLRLAYFMINGVGTALQNASASIKGGAQQKSDYQTYKDTNMQQGLENRWNKYKQETNHAIELASKRDMTEEEAYDTVKTISRNQRLNTAFNMMNEDQKLYLMNVTKEIGDKIGSFDNKELIDFLTGAAISGDKLTWQEAAAIAVARFGPDVYKAAKDGKGKISGDDVTAGIGGKGTVKEVKLSDGTVLKSGAMMNKTEAQAMKDKADALLRDYDEGKISKETFKKDYETLVNYSNSHGISKIVNGGIVSYDDVMKRAKNQALKNVFGKNDGKGKKALEFFEDNTELLNYFKENENPNYTDAPKKGIKDFKAYNKALEQYKLLKDYNAVQMINKFNSK